MFMVLLRFSSNRDRAAELLDGHVQWIQRGFGDGVFLLSGTMPGVGGAVLAHGIDGDALRSRVADDPFVRDDIVQAEIIEIEPGIVDPRLHEILADAA